MTPLKSFLLVFAFSVIVTYADDIVTLDGKTYKEAAITKVEPNGITLIYSDGAAKIPFENLNDDLKKKYNYDPQKAAEYTEQQKQAVQEGFRQNEERRQLQAKKDAELMAKRKAEAQFIADKARAQLVTGEVLQVVSAGLLIDCRRPIYRPRTSSIGSVGGGSAAPISTPDENAINGIILLRGKFKDIVDGDSISVKAVKKEPYTYTNTDGANATVNSYLPVEAVHANSP